MPYAVAPMTAEHYRDVLRLWKDNMSDPQIACVAETRYEWLYQRNPAGGATTLVVRDAASGETVGCGSAYPRRMHNGGDEDAAVVPTSDRQQRD
jgi:hypothetical protein